jgi:hypothetical protein
MNLASLSLYFCVLPIFISHKIFSQIEWVQYIFGYQNIHVALGFCVAEHQQGVNKHVRAYDLSYLRWLIVCACRI